MGIFVVSWTRSLKLFSRCLSEAKQRSKTFEFEIEMDLCWVMAASSSSSEENDEECVNEHIQQQDPSTARTWKKKKRWWD